MARRIPPESAAPTHRWAAVWEAGGTFQRVPPLAAIQRVLGPEVVQSAWVQRLARVSFLGALDVQPDAKRRYSRLDHSAAVAMLALGVAERARLSARATRTFVAAGLLHDIGHYPLSHSAEPGFVGALGADHHEVSRWIIVGAGRIGSGRSLRGTLTAAGVDPRDVWRLIVGEPMRGLPNDVATTLSGRVNIDTFDGIWKVGRTFGLPVPRVTSSAFDIARGRVWINTKSVPRVDEFWRWKGRVYRDVVNRPSNIVLESRLSDIARRATREVFEGYETFDDAVFATWGADIESERGRSKKALQLVNGRGEWQRRLKEYATDVDVGPSARGLPVRSWSARYVHSTRIVHLAAARHSPRDATAAGAEA